MEKSVKNAVFKGFPVLMESGPLGSKQYSQTTNEEKNNFLRSYFKVYYLVSKCTGKRVADRSAIDTALYAHLNLSQPMCLNQRCLMAWLDYIPKIL